jgi:hypothetical protein
LFYIEIITIIFLFFNNYLKGEKMDFYKILNEDEKHFSLKYQTGLNIDTEEFNPSGDCRPGGIYFSREDILAFLSYGPWIRKVILPEDARVYENPGKPKKWKADKVILGEREYINIDVIRRLIDEGADPTADDSSVLRWATLSGNTEIVKLLLEAGTDPKSINSLALRWAAENGHIEIVKLLLPDSIEVISLALQWAAEYGHIEIVKLLLEAGADPKTNNSLALRWAAEYGHIEVVKLLLPVSYITKYVLTYINKYCNNQEILDLIYSNYEKRKEFLDELLQDSE